MSNEVSRDYRNYIKITNNEEDSKLEIEWKRPKFDRDELRRIIDTEFEELTG